MRRRSFVTPPAGPPPSFEASTNLRQKARATGMDPNHWYAVALASELPKGGVTKVRFWKRDVAVFRDAQGVLGAVDDRCAHRQLPLSAGQVEGCKLVCPYHGWGYAADGKVVDVPHETFGHKSLRFRVESFAIREKYGLIWVFFGDPEKAETVPFPVIEELDGDDPWPCVPLVYTWTAHHTMVMDNVSDYTHGYLHRRLEPFRDPKLLDVDDQGDRIVVRYDTTIGAGKWMEPFVHRNAMGSNSITLTYDYPYHRSDTDGQIKHFIAPLPIDERTTKAFILLFYKQLRIPGTRFSVPKSLMKGVITLGNKLVVGPVFAEDGWALQLEQEAWEAHWTSRPVELNPQVKAFQELAIRKWESYLATQAGPAVAPEDAGVEASP